MLEEENYLYHLQKGVRILNFKEILLNVLKIEKSIRKMDKEHEQKFTHTQKTNTKE